MAEDASKFHIQLDGWKCSPNSSSYSPLTNLTLDLKELTCIVDTPKRRISWSTAGPESPCRPQLLSYGDDGFCESPVVTCEPFFEERQLNGCGIAAKTAVELKTRPLLQRLHSAPCYDKENVGRSSDCWYSPVKNKEDKIFDEHDSTSRDSGFSEKEELSTISKMDFKFTEPVGTAPRRIRTLSGHSPTKMSHQLPLSPVSLITLPFNQHNTCEEPTNSVNTLKVSDDDDGFLDGFDCDMTTNSQSVSIGISHLINGNLTTFPDKVYESSNFRPPLHLICNIDNDTPKGRNCIRGLFGGKKSDENKEDLDRKLTVKRSDAPRDFVSPIQNKRRKSSSFCYRALDRRELKVVPKKCALQRCHSENEATIMKAVQRSVQEPNLIGDCSRPYLLPLMNGKHKDLNTISPYTLSRLMFGEFLHEVEKFIIIDCRYPYEFEGGHIKGASNIYTKEGIQEFLCNPIKIKESDKRLIIIFHCEFSSERGPSLSRFLREKDREANKECYPHLHFPEIYLLEGGYKAFYENHAHLCEPQDYKPMLHKDHEKDMRLFRAKSKSWNSDRAGRPWSHPGLKL